MLDSQPQVAQDVGSNRVYQVSLLVYCVVQSVWAFGQIVWTLFRFQQLANLLTPNNREFLPEISTTDNNHGDGPTNHLVELTVPMGFSNDSFFDDTDAEATRPRTCAELINLGILQTYYVTAMSITLAFLLLTVLLIQGLKMKSCSLLKSYLDIDVCLTTILTIIYIFTLTQGLNVMSNREFACIYGFFLFFLRTAGIYLNSKTYLVFSSMTTQAESRSAIETVQDSNHKVPPVEFELELFHSSVGKLNNYSHGPNPNLTVTNQL